MNYNLLLVIFTHRKNVEKWKLINFFFRYLFVIYLKLHVYLYFSLQVKRYKKDLANNYNQEIERLKLEQESLKAQVEAALVKLGKDKIQGRIALPVSKINFLHLKLLLTYLYS